MTQQIDRQHGGSERGGSASLRLRLAGLVLLLAPLAGLALPQETPFHDSVRDSWSVERGLPDRTVTAIGQDGEGYLWIGLPNGVARFDGVGFTPFTSATTPGLRSDSVLALATDRQGRLLIGTERGLTVAADDGFKALGPADFAVRDLLVSDAGERLIATDSGVQTIADDGTVRTTGIEAPVFRLLAADGARWVGGLGGVHRLLGSSVSFEPLPGIAAETPVRHLAWAAGRLWAGTESGLYRRGDDGWAPFPLPVAAEGIGLVYADRDGDLWVGSRAGLSRLRDGRLIEQIDNDRMASRSELIAAFEDREANLWFGSRTLGLTRVRDGISRRLSTAEGLRSADVRALERLPDGRVLVGTDVGLDVLDPASGRFRPPPGGDALAGRPVLSLLVEPDTIWVGTESGVVRIHDGRAEPVRALAELDGRLIHGLLRDRARRLWLATSDGLFQYAGAALHRYGPLQGLPDASVRVLYQTRDGRLLIGTQGGLAEWKDGAVTALGPAVGLPAALDVTAIHELPDRRLVIGDASGSLHVGTDGQWLRLDHRDGIPQRTPTRFADDGRGQLWVATLRGLYRLSVASLHGDPDTGNATPEVLIVGHEFRDRTTGDAAPCCSGTGTSKGFVDAGKLWLPSADGVVILPMTAEAATPAIPSVRIDGIRRDGLPQSVATVAARPLPASMHELSVRVSALSFREPEAVLLEYRLLGHDDRWRQTRGREIRFHQLPAGEYTLEARARIAGAPVPPDTAAVARLGFSVAARWYQTGTFRLALALLLAAAVAGLLLQRRERRRELDAAIQRRTAELAAANRLLEADSLTDPLTGLANRRSLERSLPSVLTTPRVAETASDPPIRLLLLIDVDHFKRINDRHGHSAGDEALRQFGRLLRDLADPADLVGRWGGDEFLLISGPLPRSRGIPLASHIRTVVAAQRFELLPGTTLSLTCSIGFAEYPLAGPPPALDWPDLIELADRALYHVKDGGRDGWAAYLFTPMTRHDTLMTRLRQDLDRLLIDGSLQLLTSRDPLPDGSQAVPVAFRSRPPG